MNQQLTNTNQQQESIRVYNASAQYTHLVRSGAILSMTEYERVELAARLEEECQRRRACLATMLDSGNRRAQNIYTEAIEAIQAQQEALIALERAVVEQDRFSADLRHKPTERTNEGIETEFERITADHESRCSHIIMHARFAERQAKVQYKKILQSGGEHFGKAMYRNEQFRREFYHNLNVPMPARNNSFWQAD